MLFKIKNKFIILLFCIFSSLQADEYGFVLYNDFFVGHDGHFTNGASLLWLEDNQNNRYTNFLLRTFDTISFPLDQSKNHNAGISIDQIMLTPNDTLKTTPQYNDFPYAGYLSLSTYLFEWDSHAFNEYSMEFGVVGKESGAEWVQKTFHKIIGSEEPKGWDTQLSTRYTLNLMFKHGVKSWQGRVGNNFQGDWFNHYGATLGTFNVSAFAGSAIRIGQNYVQNFNSHYPYLKEESALLGLQTKQGFGWSASTGIDTKVLAYSHFLDTAKENGYQTDKNVLNALMHVAGTLYYNRHKFRLFYELPSRYTKEQKSLNFFGGFAYSYKF